MYSSFSLSPFKSHVRECPLLGPRPPLMWESVCGVSPLFLVAWSSPRPSQCPSCTSMEPPPDGECSINPFFCSQGAEKWPPPQPRLPWPTSDLWAAKVPPQKCDASRHSLGPVHQTAAGCLRVPLFLLLCPLSPRSPVF